MTAFVYFLPHATQPRFKIGKAVDLTARLRQLGMKFFDLAHCTAVRLTSEKDAENLERLLHRAFAQWRLAPAEVAAEEGGRTDGYTEWFQKTCFDRLGKLLEHTADLFTFTPIPAEEFSALIKPTSVREVRSASQEPAKQKGRKRRLSLEEQASQDALSVQQIQETVWAQMPILTALAECCDELEFVAQSAWYGELRGQGPGVHFAQVRELLNTMFEVSVDFANGGFRLFMDTELTGSPDLPEFSLRVGMRTPGGSGQGTWEDVAGEELAQLPFPIPGWLPEPAALAA